MSNPHQDDIGTVIQVTVLENGAPLNISNATTKQILLKKPGGALLTKTAAFVTDGTDGKIKYATIAGDLSIYGSWYVEAFLVTPTWSGYTDFAQFSVSKHL